MQARGERAVGAEQVLRDLRINRIFEGSSEIMRLFIAREAVDQHLAVAGDLIDPDVESAERPRRPVRPPASMGGGCPSWRSAGAECPARSRSSVRLARHLRFVERSSRKLARNTFYGMARWQGGLERSQAFLGRIVDIGAELWAMSAACVPGQHAGDR